MGSSTTNKTGDDKKSGVSRISEQERRELAAYDAQIDAQPMRHEDYKQLRFIEDMLFPDVAKERDKRNERNRRLMAHKAETGELDKLKEYQRKYAQENRERIRERKRQYYQKNKERIAAQQRAYQMENRERRNEWQRERRKALAIAAAAII